ncbi:MAG: DUF808 domain-containing protein [Gammaproteobacteria bacterium]|nr:DUF808 domain-containing protein [Gammaproteobacteria bacterium]
MAGSSLFALIDDIATLLDDVAILSKVALKKTAGVIGDDLALNAEQVTGVRADRELPVVWAVAKGSLVNKAILVPAALLISAVVPALILPLLMLGGAFLCFEGVEKLIHAMFHKEEVEEHKQAIMDSLINPQADLVALEKEKIKGAIRTDFILSAEIIVIVLGTVSQSSFMMQVAVLSGVALLITVGIYGLVAGIVKLDDAGLYLLKTTAQDIWGSFKRKMGKALLIFAPFLMKTLSVVGTLAMFLVGGGILMHGIPAIEPVTESWQHAASSISYIGTVMEYLFMPLLTAIFGVLAGGVLVLGWIGVEKIIKR